MPGDSLRSRLRDLVRTATREQINSAIESLPTESAQALLHDWDGIWARDSQRSPDGDWWSVFLVMAGRGFGKTRLGAEWVRSVVRSKKAGRIHIVAPTASDARDTMIEGESGLLSVHPSCERPVYQPSRRRLVWPNGAVALLFSAEEPARLRGPQCDAFWADELACWRYPEAWDQLQFGFRLGTRPQGIVTTTPRPTQIIRELLAREGKDVVVSRGTTYDNRANLADAFFTSIIRRYEGTRLGRQELNAEILDDSPGALWHRNDIDNARIVDCPPLRSIVVAVDPAVTANADSDETGIVVVGVGADRHGYVLDDVSGIYSPREWATRVVSVFDKYSANKIVAEVNNGGDMVGETIRTIRSNVPFMAVRASRGKAIRAEPIASLYEQGRIHHVGALAKLEDQMCTWDPTADNDSPDRVDALVWGISALNLNSLVLQSSANPKEQPSRKSVFGETVGW